MHIKISATIKTVGCFFKWWRKVGRNLRLQLLFFVTFHVSIQLDQLLCVICWEINHSLSVVSRYITRAPRSWFDLLYNWSPNSDLLLNKSVLELICFLNITKKSSQNWNYITRERKKKTNKITRGPRATARSPEWHNHCRYASHFDTFNINVYGLYKCMEKQISTQNHHFSNFGRSPVPHNLSKD